MKKAGFLKVGFLSAILLGLLAGGGVAYAHDGAYLDTIMAPNGGQLRMAGIYHYELVVEKNSKELKDNPVIVFVTDHAGQKISTAGATGTATILSGKEKTTTKLVPDGENRMKGIARYASTASMKGVISITLPGKQTEQVRFTPLATAQNEHMH
ncbi:MAG TPA: hypothetical protein VJ577_19150 [Burkholderiaceae bacterium]|nr:hypothetical protein [Burkholderiaceae bacterium]